MATPLKLENLYKGVIFWLILGNFSAFIAWVIEILYNYGMHAN